MLALNNFEETPLAMAAAYGRLDIVKYLLKNPKIELIHPNLGGELTANKNALFMKAIEQNDLSMVKFLLNYPEMLFNIFTAFLCF